MSRKTKLLSGESPEPPDDKNEPLEEMDKQEVQDSIIMPTSAEIILNNDEKVFLPYNLDIDQLFKQKIMNNLKFVYLLIQSELKNVRTGAIDPNDPLCIAVLYKNSVQEAIFELMSSITKMPLSHFAYKLDDAATVAVFQWLIKVITDTLGTGNKKAPKAKEA